jgi:hypothetical protein
MLLQVHDELVFEVPGPERDDVAALVVHEMEHAAELSVPLVVDLGFGKNWLETKMGPEDDDGGGTGNGSEETVEPDGDEDAGADLSADGA